MEFFEGKIVSHGSLIGISGLGQSYRDGKIVMSSISPNIKNIETDNNKTYSLKFYSYLTYAKKQRLCRYQRNPYHR